MDIRWTDEAVAALIALETSLAARLSEERARDIVNELLRRIELLRDQPRLGRAVPEIGQPQLRELVDSWNRVLYRLSTDGIEIVTIFPARVPLESPKPASD